MERLSPLLQLMHSAEELHHARQVQKNIIDTIETLNLCIPVLQHYCKLNEQMEQRQYYSALKTLEQLEHTFLPRVRGYVVTAPSPPYIIPPLSRERAWYPIQKTYTRNKLISIKEVGGEVGEGGVHLHVNLVGV